MTRTKLRTHCWITVDRRLWALQWQQSNWTNERQKKNKNEQQQQKEQLRWETSAPQSTIFWLVTSISDIRLSSIVLIPICEIVFHIYVEKMKNYSPTWRSHFWLHHYVFGILTFTWNHSMGVFFFVFFFVDRQKLRDSCCWRCTLIAGAQESSIAYHSIIIYYYNIIAH